VERGADAASSGGGTFSEDVRCPLEAPGWGGSNGGVRFEQPTAPWLENTKKHKKHRHQTSLYSKACGCVDNRGCVSGHNGHYGLTNALSKLKQTMTFTRCMGAAPCGDLSPNITGNDLEGLL
jgi:hypothetical protein